MDCVARKLGMDPLDFRLKNLIEEGESTLTGGHYRGIKAKETCSGRAAAAYNAPKGATWVVASRWVTRRGRQYLVEDRAQPRWIGGYPYIFIRTGTGTYTTLRQITAEELSCDPDAIRIEILDTDSGVSFDSGIAGAGEHGWPRGHSSCSGSQRGVTGSRRKTAWMAKE